MLQAEEASLPSKTKGTGAKAAPKKSRTLDLADLDEPSSAPGPALNATGIDNALDALSLTSAGGAAQKVDRHPERRFKAALAAYEERRLAEMADEKGLRRQQRLDLIRKEFEKHPDNPFNQISGKYNSSGQELAALREQERDAIEERLTT